MPPSNTSSTASPFPRRLSSSTASPFPHRLSSPLKPTVPPTDYPTSSSSFSSPDSSRSSSNNSTPLTSPASVAMDRAANDPSTQDFEFDDLFTFTSPSTAASHQNSSSVVGSKRAPASAVATTPQPQRRNWSKFSFSHYKPPEPTLGNQTAQRPKLLKSPRPVGPTQGPKGPRR